MHLDTCSFAVESGPHFADFILTVAIIDINETKLF